MSTEPTNDDLFQGLVISLAAATMQHLGKTLSPLTNKTEKNLDAAQSTIDMLDMLSAKTQGNLGEKESKLLKTVLAELKLNYVETLNEKPAETPPKDEKSDEKPAEKPAEKSDEESKEEADAAPAESPPEQAD
jgi:hypothetical protein